LRKRGRSNHGTCPATEKKNPELGRKNKKEGKAKQRPTSKKVGEYQLSNDSH